MSAIDAYIRTHLAAHLEVPADTVASFRFRASPGYQWSEATIEEFETTVEVKLADGTERNVYMDSKQTCEFLSGFPS